MPVPYTTAHIEIENIQFLCLEWFCGIGKTAIFKVQNDVVTNHFRGQHIYPETSCFLMSFKFFNPTCSATGRNLTPFPFLRMCLFIFNLGLN